MDRQGPSQNVGPPVGALCVGQGGAEVAAELLPGGVGGQVDDQRLGDEDRALFCRCIATISENAKRICTEEKQKENS